MQGKVKFYDVNRRFGFVENEAGEDWFFHADNVIGELPRKHDCGFRGMAISVPN